MTGEHIGFRTCVLWQLTVTWGWSDSEKVRISLWIREDVRKHWDSATAFDSLTPGRGVPLLQVCFYCVVAGVCFFCPYCMYAFLLSMLLWIKSISWILEYSLSHDFGTYSIASYDDRCRFRRKQERPRLLGCLHTVCTPCLNQVPNVTHSLANSFHFLWGYSGYKQAPGSFRVKGTEAGKVRFSSGFFC